MKNPQRSQVWYKEPWPWILMAGPAIVVVAALATFVIANKNAADLVSDDYYKDGKHIDIELHRDEAAVARNIEAQILFNPEHDAAKVLVSGEIDPQVPLNLVLLHPAKKSLDQVVKLQAGQGGVLSGNKYEYSAVLKPMPNTHHWYVRLEDTDGKWRVEDKWIMNQGDAVSLLPKTQLITPSQKTES